MVWHGVACVPEVVRDYGDYSTGLHDARQLAEEVLEGEGVGG